MLRPIFIHFHVPLKYLLKKLSSMFFLNTILLKRSIVLLVAVLLTQSVSAQIFQETFDEGTTATAGVDDIGGVTWTSTCSSCIPPGDYFYINNGQLEGQDTNGPAVWETTTPINISSCSNIEISFDLEEDDDLEGCGTGCNSVDWVQLEYNIDNTGWQTPANAFFCGGACADLMVIQADDIAGGATNYTTGCMPGGSSLQLRITVQTWAGTERWKIDNVTVSCASGPTIDAGADQSVCFGQSVTLTAFNPDGATISWANINDGIPFSPTATDYYVVTGTLDACTTTDSAQVTVTQGPTFSLSHTDATVCTPPYNGSITISGLTPGSTYDIIYNDGSIVGPNSYLAGVTGEIVLTGLPGGNYWDFIVDSSGCYTIDGTVINIGAPPDPVVGAGNDLTVCDGDQVTLTANNPDGASISWDNSVVDGVPFTPPIGTTTYTVTAVDGLGCNASDSVDVTVIPTTTTTVDPAGPYTISSGIQNLTSTPAGGTWSADCGSCVDANTGAFDPAVAGVGTWEVCYTAGTAPCEDSTCISITVSACGISATITPNPPSCNGLSDGSATISISGQNGSVTFVITDSLGNQVNTLNSNTANNLGEGWYYFEVTDQSCTLIDSVFLDDPEPISIVLDITDPLCYGIPDGFVVVDTVLNAQGNYNNITYNWNPNPNGQNGVGQDTLPNIGGGQYTLLVDDEVGCSETVTFTVTYPDSLYLETGTEPAYCRIYSYQSGNGVVYASAFGGTPTYTYAWYNLSDSSLVTNSTWGGLNPGDYSIVVTDAHGCVVSQTVSLDSLNPIADFDIVSDDFTTEWEGTAIVDASFINQSDYFANPQNPLADTTFFWNFGLDTNWVLSTDYYETFDQSYTSGGTYEVCLVAINKNGCTDTACVELIIYDQQSFEPVNVFTPNGDGANDLFTFSQLSQSVSSFSCVIVNRWGVVITEFDDISDSWDGTDKNGSECPEGVYFYKYEGTADNGDVFSGQGNIHLIGK